MGGILGIGGSASKTDRQHQLQGYGDLQNVFNYGIPAGQAGQQQGQSDLGDASNFWQKILGGDRSAISAALSPEISSITSQNDQNRKQQAAMGTARGGGTNAQNQQQQQVEQGQITNLINGARPQAAQQVQGIGTTELSNSQNLLGLGTGAASNLTGDATKSYETSADMNEKQGAGAGQLASLLLGF